MVSTLSRWADEAPEVMRRLLTDPTLQRLLLDALAAAVEPPQEAQRPDSDAQAG